MSAKKDDLITKFFSLVKNTKSLSKLWIILFIVAFAAIFQVVSLLDKMNVLENIDDTKSQECFDIVKDMML